MARRGEHLACRALWACLLLALASDVHAGGVHHPSALYSRRLLLLQPIGSGGVPILLAAVAGGLGILALFAVGVVFLVRYVTKASPTTVHPHAEGRQEKNEFPIRGKAAVEPLNLSFNEVQVATEGFKPEHLLSESNHGTVFKAEGPSAESWVVKRAKESSLQGEHLFRNEVEFLSKIAHPNLLQVQAFCDEGSEQILVFEYMPNGSLTSWLRPPAGDFREPLTLAQRLDISVGIAEALRYLHSFTKPTIIHRDVMSNTVLLDASFKPKLGGLGLLKHLPGEGLRLRMASKKGYLDPEYFQTFKVTAKCDVYSFGVVLLEMLTGCAPIIQVTRSGMQRPMTLQQWALQAVEENMLLDILDPRMTGAGQTSPKEVVEAFAKIACACVAPLRKDRPDMAKVAYLLGELRKGPSPSRSQEIANIFSKLMHGHRVIPVSSPK